MAGIAFIEKLHTNKQVKKEPIIPCAKIKKVIIIQVKQQSKRNCLLTNLYYFLNYLQTCNSGDKIVCQTINKDQPGQERQLLITEQSYAVQTKDTS